jgi:hypothetical protein
MTAKGTQGPAGRRPAPGRDEPRGRAAARAAVFLGALRVEPPEDARGEDVRDDEEPRRAAPAFPEEVGPALRREAPRCDDVLLLMRRSSREKACGRVHEILPRHDSTMR